MGQEWVNMAQACRIYGVSRRTLTRWINQGKIQSKLENNRRLVFASDVGHSETELGHDDSGMSQEMSQQVLVEQLRSEIEFLRQQIDVKDKEIAEKGKLLDQEQQLSLIYRKDQKALESAEQKARRGWWSRLFKRHPDESN
jgi:methyl coenzyme M reductase gamma subunit